VFFRSPDKSLLLARTVWAVLVVSGSWAIVLLLRQSWGMVALMAAAMMLASSAWKILNPRQALEDAARRDPRAMSQLRMFETLLKETHPVGGRGGATPEGASTQSQAVRAAEADVDTSQRAEPPTEVQITQVRTEPKSSLVSEARRLLETARAADTETHRVLGRTNAEGHRTTGGPVSEGDAILVVINGAKRVATMHSFTMGLFA